MDRAELEANVEELKERLDEKEETIRSVGEGLASEILLEIVAKRLIPLEKIARKHEYPYARNLDAALTATEQAIDQIRRARELQNGD